MLLLFLWRWSQGQRDSVTLDNSECKITHCDITVSWKMYDGSLLKHIPAQTVKGCRRNGLSRWPQMCFSSTFWSNRCIQDICSAGGGIICSTGRRVISPPRDKNVNSQTSSLTVGTLWNLLRDRTYSPNCPADVFPHQVCVSKREWRS